MFPICVDWKKRDMNQDCPTNRSSIRQAALSWSGGALRVVKLASSDPLLATPSGEQASASCETGRIAGPVEVGGGGPATTARPNTHYRVATDSVESSHIADPGNDRVRRVDSSGFFSGTVIGKEGHEHGVGGDGGSAYAADGEHDR